MQADVCTLALEGKGDVRLAHLRPFFMRCPHCVRHCLVSLVVAHLMDNKILLSECSIFYFAEMPRVLNAAVFLPFQKACNWLLAELVGRMNIVWSCGWLVALMCGHGILKIVCLSAPQIQDRYPKLDFGVYRLTEL